MGQGLKGQKDLGTPLEPVEWMRPVQIWLSPDQAMPTNAQQIQTLGCPHAPTTPGHALLISPGTWAKDYNR